MPDFPTLPVDAIRHRFLAAFDTGPVVVTAPTGSGKSTAVPRWCTRAGRVLVVEPRRVACRGLAAWVSKLEETALGQGVGYAVRDERRYRDDSRVVFATPGVVIRWLTRGAPLPFDAAIIDEFHERSLEVDLLFALLKRRFQGKLVVMSATIAAERVAAHLNAALVEGQGRLFDVTVHHLKGDALLPTVKGLESRVVAALYHLEERGSEGDVLVFLPGKAEIAKLQETLKTKTRREVLTVHGGLRLNEQNRVFEGGRCKRVILSTNVAETSITIPNIDAVIDTGLVRRTRYANGRGFLTLGPIAVDSADQRAGRAGRVKSGICYRLWSAEAVLQPVTPPEIYRSSLTPLLLAAAACGTTVDELPFLDPPKPYAVTAALDELSNLRALDDDGKITQRGRALFGYPLDPPLASLLVEAEKEGCLRDAIDLVSALSVGRPIFHPNRPEDPEDDLRYGGCDALALIKAMRVGEAGKHHLIAHVLGEAKSTRRRLFEGWGLTGTVERDIAVDRGALVRAALSSDPKAAFVARRRKGRTYWAGGGTEVLLSKESAVDAEKHDAIAMLASMALGEGHRKDTVIVTAAMPVRLADLAETGLGEDQIAHAAKAGGVIKAEIRRVFAGKVIAVREEIPEGEMARAALEKLLLGGGLFKDAIAAVKETLDNVVLAKTLNRRLGPFEQLELGEWAAREAALNLDAWVRKRTAALGFESGEDLALLREDDFGVPALPEETAERLLLQYPRILPVGNATYAVAYDVAKREVTLDRIIGNNKQPPSLATLPAFRGFKIKVKHHSKVWVLRER
ncbi:MAG: helicase-related protein [Planctomycetia bacterium]|jgi:ATP-dependent helicase HrpB